jgi:hypothetical protein
MFSVFCFLFCVLRFLFSVLCFLFSVLRFMFYVLCFLFSVFCFMSSAPAGIGLVCGGDGAWVAGALASLRICAGFGAALPMLEIVVNFSAVPFSDDGPRPGGSEGSAPAAGKRETISRC